MDKVTRRAFVSGSLGAAAALSFPGLSGAQAQSAGTSGGAREKNAPDIVDTNVHLFDWPFRKLKYGKTTALIEKLRKHRVTQAWAGSYEALFYKDINGVNIRLAEECRQHGKGMLLPFGTVNLAWPDWREDLRRCHEVLKMPGIRVYPLYQTFDFAHPDFAALLEEVNRRKMILQIVGDMEDIRHHHPIVEVRSVNFEPLVDLLGKVSGARVQLVYWNHRVARNLLSRMVNDTRVYFDTSRVEGAGEVGRLIAGKSWSGDPTAVPADRFVFGSHAPYFPLEANIIKLFEAPLTLEEITGIMNANARKLLKTT